MGPVAMILVFWMLGFKPTFSLSSFTFIKKLFISSLISAIRVVSFAYLRLLIFLPAILIPACASSSLAFLMVYSAYKLNKEGNNIHPWCTPFLIWNHFIVLCLVLTVASWPAYRFLRRQVRCYLMIRKSYCMINIMTPKKCSLGADNNWILIFDGCLVQSLCMSWFFLGRNLTYKKRYPEWFSYNFLFLKVNFCVLYP